MVLLALAAILSLGAGSWTSNKFLWKPPLGSSGEINFNVGFDRVDTRMAKEIWVGDPKYGSTIQTAIDTIGASNAVLRIAPGTHNISNSINIPANVTLKPERGAIIAIPPTKTLTLNGGLQSGLHQIFACAGTGKVVFGTGVPECCPEWFGAKGDNSADDADAINNAGIACRNSYVGIALIFPSGKGYKITKLVDLTGIKFIKMPRNYGIYGYGPGVLVRLGYNAQVGSIEGPHYEIAVWRDRDWSAGNINIEVLGMDTGAGFFSARGGNVGVRFFSDTAYPMTCNGRIDLGNFVQNATDILFKKATSQGWIQCMNKNYTLTTAAVANDDHVHLSSITGISSGDIIAIDLDNGLQHYTTVNGAPSGDQVNLTAVMPSAAAIGNAAKTNVWKVLPNIGP